jgi:hypothetical protein
MSRKRAVEIKPGVDPSTIPVEAAAMFRHDGVYRRPGEIIEMDAADAADLIAMGFARPAGNVGYKRRDIEPKG